MLAPHSHAQLLRVQRTRYSARIREGPQVYLRNNKKVSIHANTKGVKLKLAKPLSENHVRNLGRLATIVTFQMQRQAVSSSELS